MTQTEALETVHAYAIEYDVPWVGVFRMRKSWAWWYFRVDQYHVEVDTGGQGAALATVNTQLRDIV